MNGTHRVSSNHYEVLAYLILKIVVGAFILLIASTYVDYARIIFLMIVLSGISMVSL